MIDKNRVINSVSPLKKRSKSYKGGTTEKRSATVGKTFAGTKMHARHGGFGASTAVSNKAGYNIATRFRIPNEKQFPSSGSNDNSPPAPSKPYQFGPDGSINFNPVINVSPNFNNNPNFVNKNANINQTGGTDTIETPGHWKTTTKERKLEGYNEFWDKRIKSEKNWSKGMRQYIEKWKKNNPDKEPDLSFDGEIYKEWERVSKKYAHQRNKGRSTKTETSREWVPGSKRTISKSGSNTAIINQ
tara:strand:+ start:1262 stop:1993 length:732 start_codon:yes stop_codon:yes gene_type:complete